MISHEKKFIFVHVPKTAGSSMEKALVDESCILLPDQWDGKRIPYAPLNHLTLREIVNNGFISQSQLNSYFKFCFVRNPWDKVISEIFCPWIGHEFKGLTIEQAINEVCKLALTPTGIGNHIRPQYQFISTDNSRMDFIGRFENLEEDFNYVCDCIGIERVSLPYLNPSQHRPYWSYYNKQTKLWVEETYRQDIDCFNYEFN